MANDELARKVLAALEMRGESEEVHQALVSGIADVIDKRFSRPILPSPGESLAFSLMKPKTAALAFDRVYSIPANLDPPPAEIGFYGATRAETIFWAAGLVAIAAQEVGMELMGEASGDAATNEAQSLRFLCSELRSLLRIDPVIFYHNDNGYRSDYPLGERQLITTTLTNLVSCRA